MSDIRLVFVLIMVGSAMVPLGCAEKLPEEKPNAPDMSALVNAYAAPTLPFDATTAPQVVTALLDRVPVLGSFCGWESVQDITCNVSGGCASCTGFTDVLDLLRGVGEERASQTSALSPDAYATSFHPLEVGGTVFQGDGFMRVTRICDGGVPTADPDEAANGSIELIVGFTDEGLDPTIWGDFTACRLRTTPEPMVLDGSLQVHWEASDGLDLATLEGLTAIFALDGSVQLGENSLALSDDMRVRADGSFELRVATPDGHVFFFVATNGTTVVQGFRASNGEFACDFAAATCTDDAGNTVSYGGAAP